MINRKTRQAQYVHDRTSPDGVHIQIKQKNKISHPRKALSLQLIDAQLNIFK